MKKIMLLSALLSVLALAAAGCDQANTAASTGNDGTAVGTNAASASAQ